jgi:hypothetical protein
MRRIITLGDSHVRSFAKNENFFPLFIGSGKEMCFIDDKSYNHTLSTTKKVLSNFNKEDVFMLVFGEPDCRWFSGKGWHPWLSNSSVDLNREGLKSSIERFLKFITELSSDGYKNLCIYNATPSKRKEQNKMILAWNNVVKDFCEDGDFLFIDISSEVNSNLENYLADEVHLNDKVSSLVLNILFNKNIIDEIKNDEYNYIYQDVKDRFKFNPKFNCFTYSD